MNRFKVIGLAVAALVALPTVAASGAMGAAFHSQLEHTHLTGHLSSSTEEQQITWGLATAECETIHLTGTVLSETKEPSTVTIHPEYGGCHFGGSATVTTTGCDYVLHAETTSGRGHVDIACEGTSKIIETLDECTFKIGPQTGMTGGAVYANVGSGSTEELEMNLAIANIAITEKTGPLCGLFPNTGSYSGRFKLAGFSATPETMGAQAGIHWE